MREEEMRVRRCCVEFGDVGMNHSSDVKCWEVESIFSGCFSCSSSLEAP